MEKEKNTQEQIICAAREEFLEKGFLNASLRNIVKKAGVTTGAFYRYYASKEELFSALVEEQKDYVLSMFDRTLEEFERLPGEEQTSQMWEVSDRYMMETLDYAYEHMESFRLLLTCAEGTPHGDFLHQLVIREVDCTFRYIEVLQGMGKRVEPIRCDLCHMIVSGMLSGFFETIVHDMPKADAVEYVRQLRRFHTAGWSELLGVGLGGDQDERKAGVSGGLAGGLCQDT